MSYLIKTHDTECLRFVRRHEKFPAPREVTILQQREKVYYPGSDDYAMGPWEDVPCVDEEAVPEFSGEVKSGH